MAVISKIMDRMRGYLDEADKLYEAAALIEELAGYPMYDKELMEIVARLRLRAQELRASAKNREGVTDGD